MDIIRDHIRQNTTPDELLEQTVSKRKQKLPVQRATNLFSNLLVLEMSAMAVDATRVVT